MGVYDELGVRTVINASGSLTRLGGTRMEPEVLEAMAEAAASFVRIDELQARAGEIIAEVTGAEAGYVVTGAAAGLALGTAACVAGLDVAKMDQLPDTTSMKNEVVVQRGHRNAYDHALRMAGIKFVEVGYLAYPGAGGTYGWQIDAAINERTAAVACPIIDTPGTVPLAEVAEIAHARGVPVIVDAAATLPPRSNLRRFIGEGADLVTYSGGKAIRGPQASGILAGRADLIASVTLQHQDMDVRMATWGKRDLFQRGVVAGIPHQGFGRAMKVGREEVVGLITALKRFVAGSDKADSARWSAQLDEIERGLGNMPHMTITRAFSNGGVIPLLRITIDERSFGKTAYQVLNELLDGTPSIALAETHAEFGTITINPHALDDREIPVITDRLRAVLGAPAAVGR
jgi:L-seryl-tRNA(Ser) seleniumtransferase